MSGRRLAGVILVLSSIAAAPPAEACNETSTTSSVVAASADGTFVAVEKVDGGGFHAEVIAVAADGATLARCTSIEDEPWRCTGDARLRARTGERAAQVAARWASVLGAAPVTLQPIAAPPGVTEAFCARFRVFMAMEEVGCGVADTEILGLAGSRFVFARTRLGPVPFCGAADSYDGTRWLTVEALGARLERRADVFERRARRGSPAVRARAHARARSAREAQAWLAQRTPA